MNKTELLKLIESANTPKEITLALLSAMVVAPEQTESILKTMACAYIKEKSKRMELETSLEKLWRIFHFLRRLEIIFFWLAASDPRGQNFGKTDPLLIFF